MKKLNNIRGRKGFTLVECVIAVAVFAVLTLMIMMILANTTTLSKTARDNEENLNNLVENVVEDKSVMVYGNDSKSFELYDAGGTSSKFKASFSLIDGTKNFVKCPESACHYIGGSNEFIEYIRDSTEYSMATADQKQNLELSYWFGQSIASDGTKTVNSNNFYKCPVCGHETPVASVVYHCNSCLAEGNIGFASAESTSKFRYDNYSGNIICNSCGGSNVVEKDIMDDVSVTQDSALHVSGLRANAIRYGTVKRHKAKEIQQLATITTTEHEGSVVNFTMQIDKMPRTAVSKPVVYQVTLTVPDTIQPKEDGNPDKATIQIKLPGGYVCDITDKGTCTGAAGAPKVSVVQDASHDITSDSIIQVSGITELNKSYLKFKFALVSSGNGNSFEDDYAYEFETLKSSDPYCSSGGTCALMKFWLACPSNSTNVPRTDVTIPTEEQEEEEEEETPSP